jgi:hypothetical protein
MERRTLLHVLVRQRNWSYSAFRRAYEQAAKHVARDEGDPSLASATVAEKTYRRWTSGEVRTLPQAPGPAILEHLFQRPAAELLAPPIGQVEPPPRAPAIDERELTMTARDAAEHAGQAAAQTLPDLTIDQVEDDVRALARAYPRTTPLESYQQGRDLLERTQAMLTRTQRPRQRERLYLQAGAASALLASAAFDLGSLTSAVQLARTAALYGEVIDHGPLQAYAHGALAYLAYWDGRPAEAVRLVTTAQGFGGCGDTAALRLATIAARAHAHLGDADAAHGAIHQVEEPGSGRRDDLHDDVGGEFGMPFSRAVMSTATTYLVLNAPSGAVDHATRALDMINTGPAAEQPALRGKAAIDLARARLLGGELEGALDAVAPAFDLDSGWRTLGVLERMASLRADLTRSGLQNAAAARELGERAEEFTATGAAYGIGPTSMSPALGR